MPRWDDLEMFTNEEDSIGGMFCWEVGLGRVLAAVRRKDWSALETNLQVQIIFFALILNNGFFGRLQGQG